MVKKVPLLGTEASFLFLFFVLFEAMVLVIILMAFTHLFRLEYSLWRACGRSGQQLTDTEENSQLERLITLVKNTFQRDVSWKNEGGRETNAPAVRFFLL